MDVREATESDIPAIVSLLKQSLGESLMPKSESYWNWKHVENPFGKSPVLLCWEGTSLVGVRAFMRWEWIQNNQVYKAVRAVDTATHPDHQGKGIFKKLTLALVNYCQDRGDHFIFNTPNGQSKPGYLKMGWEEVGKMPISLNLVRPFKVLRNYLRGVQAASTDLRDSRLSYYLDHSDLGSLLSKYRNQATHSITNISTRYLQWRYKDVPVAKYLAIGIEDGDQLSGLVIGRLKHSKFGNELRLTDCFFTENKIRLKLLSNIAAKKRDWGVDYITTAASSIMSTKPLGGLGFIAKIGPMVTVRKLAQNEMSPHLTFTNWSPSLGDLELF